MTRRTSESEWAHLFDTPPPVPQQTTSVESTVVVANSSALLASAGVGVGGGGAAGTSAGIGSSSSANRRAGKPARRRTRASRKAPTTLFNTDTNNFRAMVQQFTGFPSLQGEGQGHGLHLPSQQPPAMTFQNHFNQHQHPLLLSQPEVTGGAPFPLSVQQQQVYLDEEHLFGFGSSSNEINPFMSGFSRGGSSSNANNNNNSNNDGNNNNDDENKQNPRSNMEYFSFDEFDRTNDRF